MKGRLRYIYLLAFIVGAYLLLPVMNGDYLYTIQDNNVFISGHTFMMDIVTHEGGWLAWMACYLTQFFYYPWLGSTMLILLWAGIYWMTIWILDLSDKLSFLALILPSILLYHLLDYGYWIYYAKAPGFPFWLTLLIFFCLLYVGLFMLLTRRLQISWLYKKGIALGVLLLILFVYNGLCPSSPWRYNHHFHGAIMTTLTDPNFRREMKVYRALDELRFEDALNDATAGSDAPTRLVMLYRNIALMQTGQLQQQFKYDNNAVPPYADDALQVHISQMGGSLIYYHYGQINYAYRRAMESAVKYGLSFRNLKMMARCALVNQEHDLAAKYLTMLKSSIFHRSWAVERERWLLSGTEYVKSAEYQTIAPLLNDDVDMLGNDDGLCEKYILEHFSDLIRPKNALLEELAMCTSLQTKDTYAFCVHFYDYAHGHPNAPIPALYQEGAILLATAEESPITLGDFRFDAVVSDKYNRFVHDYNSLSQMGLDGQEMGRRLRPQYGDTYWWYYYFCNDYLFY